MRVLWLCACVSVAASAADLQLKGTPSGVLEFSDGQSLGQLRIVAWDRSWANTSQLRNVHGQLPGRLTATMDLPGDAAGEATITIELQPQGEFWAYSLTARFSAATELNAFAASLAIPLPRLLGHRLVSLPDGAGMPVGEDKFGGTVACSAVAAELGGGQSLLFGAWGAPILVQDNRAYNSPTAELRQVLVTGKVSAGQTVTRKLLLALWPTAEAAERIAKLMPKLDYDRKQPAVLGQPNGELTWLGAGGSRQATILLGIHGRDWALAEQTGTPASSYGPGSRSWDGSLEVPKTAHQITYTETLRELPDGFEVSYDLRRPVPLPLNSQHLSWYLDLKPILGRTVTLVGDRSVEVPIPVEHGELHLAQMTAKEIRLWPDQPDGAVIQLDPPLPVLVQDNRRFGSDRLELRFEFGSNMDQDLPAGDASLKLTAKPTTPTHVLTAGESVQQSTDTSDWFAYTLPWDSCPVDVSFLNDQPAGTHGLLTIKDGQFVFTDGTPARFWGTCFSAGENFPTHEQSEKIAQRLAKFGVNIVRTHHADANWAQPNFFAYEGDATGTTTDFQQESLDRFDYLMYCLKQQGVYLYLDQLVHRKFTAQDGVDAADQLENAGKPYSNFDPKLIEVQQEFSRKLLSHVNPYTKLAYREDPAVVLMEFANENDLMTQRVELEPYRSRLETKYRAWAKTKGIDVPPGKVAFRIDQTPTLQFLVETQAVYYDQMTRFMRDLGVKIPLTGSNWSRNAGLLVALQGMDYTDSHAYHDHPHEGRFSNTRRIGAKGTMMGSLSFNRVQGKPFFVSEWDTPWPNEWRAELPLWIAAVAGLQQWGGLTVYTYRHTAAVPIDRLSGAFETFNDPCRFGLFPAAALIYRRGDLAPAKETVTISLPRERALTAPSPGGYSVPALSLTPEVHRAEMTLDQPAGSVPFDQPVVQADDRIVSDTGELTRHLGAGGYGTVDTPRSKAAYGNLGQAGKVSFDGVDLQVTTPFATVAVSSLTDQPIASSNRLLVTAVARAENTGLKYNATRTSLAGAGDGPILCEPVVGNVSITTSAKGWRLLPVKADGSYGQPLAVTVEGGRLQFRLDGSAKTIYYLLEAE